MWRNKRSETKERVKRMSERETEHARTTKRYRGKDKQKRKKEENGVKICKEIKKKTTTEETGR